MFFFKILFWMMVFNIQIQRVTSDTEGNGHTGTTQNLKVKEVKGFFWYLGLAALIIGVNLLIFLVIFPAVVTVVARYRLPHKDCRLYSIGKPNPRTGYGKVLLSKEKGQDGSQQTVKSGKLYVNGLVICLALLSMQVQESLQVTIGKRMDLAEFDNNQIRTGVVEVGLPDENDIRIQFDWTAQGGVCNDSTISDSCNGTCEGLIFSFWKTENDSFGIRGFPVLYDCDLQRAKAEPSINGNKRLRKRDTCVMHGCGHKVRSYCEGCPGDCIISNFDSRAWCFQAPGEREKFLSIMSSITSATTKINARLGDSLVESAKMGARLDVLTYKQDAQNQVVDNQIMINRVELFKLNYLQLLSDLRELKRYATTLSNSYLTQCLTLEPELLVAVDHDFFQNKMVAELYLNVGSVSCSISVNAKELLITYSLPLFLGLKEHSVLNTIPHRVQETETTCSIGPESLTAVRLEDGLKRPWGPLEIRARTPGIIERIGMTSSGSGKEIDGKWLTLLKENTYIMPTLSGTTVESDTCPRFQIFWDYEFAIVISLMNDIFLNDVNQGAGVSVIQYSNDSMLLRLGEETFKTPVYSQPSNISITLSSEEIVTAYIINSGRLINTANLTLDRDALNEDVLLYENRTAAALSIKIDDYQRQTEESRQELEKIQNEISEEQNKTWDRASVGVAMGSGACGGMAILFCCFCVMCLYLILKAVQASRRFGSYYTHRYCYPTLAIVRKTAGLCWIFNSKIVQTDMVLVNITIFMSWKIFPQWKFLIKFGIIPIGACVPFTGGAFPDDPKDISEGKRFGAFENEGPARGQKLIQGFRKNKVAPLVGHKDLGDGELKKPEEKPLWLSVPTPEFEIPEYPGPDNKLDTKIRIEGDDLMIMEEGQYALFTKEKPLRVGGQTWYAESGHITNGYEELNQEEFRMKIID